MSDGPKANPLVGDRLKLEAECLRLVRQRAEETGKDAVEIIAEASEHKGRAKLNPASMTDDRLLHTVRALRRQIKVPAAASEMWIAADWVAENGGEAVLAKRLMDWLARERHEGESEQAAKERWAMGIPDGVLSFLARALYFERKRRAG